FDTGREIPRLPKAKYKPERQKTTDGSHESGPDRGHTPKGHGGSKTFSGTYAVNEPAHQNESQRVSYFECRVNPAFYFVELGMMFGCYRLPVRYFHDGSLEMLVNYRKGNHLPVNVIDRGNKEQERKDFPSIAFQKSIHDIKVSLVALFHLQGSDDFQCRAAGLFQLIPSFVFDYFFGKEAGPDPHAGSSCSEPFGKVLTGWLYSSGDHDAAPGHGTFERLNKARSDNVGREKLDNFGSQFLCRGNLCHGGSAGHPGDLPPVAQQGDIAFYHRSNDEIRSQLNVLRCRGRIHDRSGAENQIRQFFFYKQGQFGEYFVRKLPPVRIFNYADPTPVACPEYFFA